MMQKEFFMQGEGDAWLNRNREKLGLHDPVSDLIEQQGIRPTSILEIGCADGWRLQKLRTLYGARVHGVEPSMEAGIEAAERRVPVHQMTASCLPVIDGGFDMIIYGFCLYVTDPKDWFTIVAESDRALVDGGHLVIHDFINPAPGRPFARRYEHHDALLAYHFPFESMWLSHPLYSRVALMDSAPGETVTILRKAPRNTIPVRP